MLPAAPATALPQDYGYVILAVLFYIGSIVKIGSDVIGARKKLGVPLPIFFENTPKSIFNRYQRAHYNALEYAYGVVAVTLLAGLASPHIAAASISLNAIGRLSYAHGYQTKGPDGRWFGGIVQVIADVPLALTVVWLALNNLGFV